MAKGSPKDSSIERRGPGTRGAVLSRTSRRQGLARWLWVLLGSALAAFLVWRLMRPSNPSGPSDARTPAPAHSAHERLRELLGDAGTRRSIDTRPAESALAPLRAQLNLPPRAWPSEHLVFAGDRVARTVEAGIEVVALGETPAQAKRSTVRASHVRALFELGRTFGAVAEKNVLLFEPGKDAPARLPGVTWLPQARVFPDLISRNYLLVLQAPDHAIYRYFMAEGKGPLLPLVARHDLVDFDEKVFVALRDGSFVYSSGGSFNRLYTSGLTKKLVAPRASAAPLRGLRARRIDQIFVLYEDGLVQKLYLQDRVRVAWSTRLHRLPFDLVASGDDLVLLEDVPGDRREWRLRVVGAGRESPLVIELGTSKALGEDWVQRLHERFGLAVSKGRVAVVGPGGLGAWNLATGEPLLTSR